ncbi:MULTISPECIES: GntR family transcriptional regulator [Streptomyces]|uniref:GntR family transcriptional regulator n=1 Tax=Streptomyces fungicidicus TaxID=68203 RepID=A0A494V9X1_9ACTN|nr:MULTISPECIES: GntR family transcriptional regulator [Streptomyces]AYL39978.1 GntR family transcriptional regulator [Streptomyces fungicidicus]QKW03908.1 GntR family transcriptional regulator [Streptomyces sp. NA02536]
MSHLKSRAISVQTHLRDQVADALRAALIAGELRPGVVYSAPTLAAELGVSATPVREAMLDLAREGLVEAVRNKGFRVTEMTEQDLDEFTEIRTLIEVPTVGRVAATAAVQQLESLRPLAQRIVTAAQEHDVLKYLEADHRFHLELLALAGNRHLVEVVSDLRKRSRLFGLGSLNEAGRLVASAQEHVELLDLMVAGRIREAEECMRRHLAHVRSLWADGRADAAEREPALRLGGR